MLVALLLGHCKHWKVFIRLKQCARLDEVQIAVKVNFIRVQLRTKESAIVQAINLWLACRLGEQMAALGT